MVYLIIAKSNKEEEKNRATHAQLSKTKSISYIIFYLKRKQNQGTTEYTQITNHSVQFRITVKHLCLFVLRIT